MGLTERHWFENEDVPENYEWALEDAVYNSHTNKKADMVKVIWCKDCKNQNWVNEETGYIVCKVGRGSNPPDWFCADGERR